ncbi:pentatricopeptide repeat-containing protein At1g06143 [Chenopodium quinoa]|uniref:pentatricopeptide repeat-containing protein At1g06143 n=1 Tax=Chenopodium quinoa TaxID=63459 RepID=UPI000B7751D5|nr:pentatricopeptide repeat-containing protein At1g06143 [Chenopodium quinoa]
MALIVCRKDIAYLNQFFPSKFAQTIKFIHTETLVSHLKNCSNFPDLQSLQASMIKSDNIKDCYVMTQFISVCSSLNQIDYANLAVTQMKSPNVFVYNSLIRGVIDWGRPIQALKLYLKMLRTSIYPTSYTLSPLIKACGQAFDLKTGECVHCHAWKLGFDAHVFVLTALVDFYGKLGRLVEARKVFDEMPERDTFAWSTIVSVHARGGDMASARNLFDGMPQRNATAWNTMIDGYARLGDVEAAELLFDQMSEKDLVSWTTMIACYTQNKEYKKALAAYDEMLKNGICPDKRTLATVVSCCAHLGALDLGRKIHFYIVREGFLLDVYIGSALVDMYAKCGKLERSLVIFFNLREKNLYCWNSIIEGLAAHGYGKLAIAMFDKMLEEIVKPNGVTFISVLSACTHAGLVEEGREIFQSMINDFQICPELKHYGCMVDLLCKAKLLEDALELIKSMKIEPNSVIWGALLSGSKLCQNLEIAELAVSKLMELEPDNCGYYSLLLSMYAEASRWSEVKKIRAIMREQGIEKSFPGSSWIELENELHQFVAADKSHPASNEICILLDELYRQLKPASVSI